MTTTVHILPLSTLEIAQLRDQLKTVPERAIYEVITAFRELRQGGGDQNPMPASQRPHPRSVAPEYWAGVILHELHRSEQGQEIHALSSVVEEIRSEIIGEAVERERERCAARVTEMSEHANRLGSYREATAFVDAAAAIRAGRSDNLKLPEGDQKP